MDASAFAKSLEAIDHSSFGTASARKQALEAVQALNMRLETPMDTMLRLAWLQPSLYFALKVAVDLDWFAVLHEAHGEPLTSTHLASKSGAEPQLTKRLTRHLAAMGVLNESSPDTYQPTPLSNALAATPMSSTVTALFDLSLKIYTNFPELLSQNGYNCPTTPASGPWQFAHNTQLDFFDWIKDKPHYTETFANTMTCYRTLRPPWTDLYPTDELLKGAMADDILVVDVGGNSGGDLESMITKHPQLEAASPQRLMVQDQPQVVETVTLHPAIKGMEHDFFTPQPVKGARVYFLHSVLHDWPDANALNILENLRPALKPGYSKLLICEVVIPKQNASPSVTMSDIAMMAFHGSRERTESEFTALLQQAGFHVVKFWSKQGVVENVIEAEVR